MANKLDHPRTAHVVATVMIAMTISSAAMAQPGDVNCDGAVNHADVLPFTVALIDPAAYAAAYPNCNINRADMNADTLIDGRDMQPFVSALLAPPCPAGLTNCGGVCVDLNYDSQNCGSCGNVCASGETCSGSCIPSEPPP